MLFLSSIIKIIYADCSRSLLLVGASTTGGKPLVGKLLSCFKTTGGFAEPSWTSPWMMDRGHHLERGNQEVGMEERKERGKQKAWKDGSESGTWDCVQSGACTWQGTAKALCFLMGSSQEKREQTNLRWLSSASCGSQVTLSWLPRPSFTHQWQSKNNSKVPQIWGEKGQEKKATLLSPHLRQLSLQLFPEQKRNRKTPVVWWMKHWANAFCSNKLIW